MAATATVSDGAYQRQQVLAILETAGQEQVTAGLEAAKAGKPLPERKALGVLCGNVLTPDGPNGAWESSTHKFWEGRRQRLKDAIHALGLVDPPAGNSKPGVLATPLRANTPVKSGTPLNKPHNLLAGAFVPSTNPALPKPTPAKPPTGTPTFPDSKKRKAAPSLQAGKNKATTPRSRTSLQNGEEATTPSGGKQQEQRAASKDIKVADWDAPAVRCVMVAYQSRFEVAKDYIMPKALPANLFKKPTKRR